MAKAEKEWQQFRVGKISTKPNWTEPKCQSFTNISHVSHINSAINIFQTGTINSGLVFDESLLNRSRILVVWLSPNDWHGAGGFRYGNVRFNFDWGKLITDKNYYWIESIAYGIPAARILVTDNNHSSRLPAYDPKIGDGPWWYDEDTNTHYRNGNICLEFLFERNISLGEITSFDFVNHHSKYCCIDPGSCPDCGVSQYEAGSKFICALAALDNDRIEIFFKRHPSTIDMITLKGYFSYFWSNVHTKIGFSGNITASDNLSKPLGRAILNSYARFDFDELDLLQTLYKNQRSVIESCAKLVGDCFNVPWEELI